MTVELKPCPFCGKAVRVYRLAGPGEGFADDGRYVAPTGHACFDAHGCAGDHRSAEGVRNTRAGEKP